MIQSIKNLLAYKGLKAKLNAINFWIQKRLSGKYYSQHGQDKFVTEKLFPGKVDGVFVDIGANDGISFSNTYLLEKIGWKGIAVESIPAVYSELVRNRNCTTVNACIAAQTGTELFRVISGDAQMLSGLVNEYDQKHVERINAELESQGGEYQDVEIACITFSELLEENNIPVVDYLSIDVEGAEFKILNSIDFDRTHVVVISVENNYADPRIPDLLASKGYEFHSRIGADEFYRYALTNN
jgi:FkbM family methyltransferase